MSRQRACVLLLALLVCGSSLAVPAPVAAREFDIEGTIDCGKPTGALCIPVGRQVGVLTESISGTRQHVKIDLSWVLDRPVKRRGRPSQSLTNERPGVVRGLFFRGFRDRVDALHGEGIPTERLSAEDARALVRAA